MTITPGYAPAVRFATYPGNATGNIGYWVGPNTLDEVLCVVQETYDEATNTTRLGFAYGTPDEDSVLMPGHPRRNPTDVR